MELHPLLNATLNVTSAVLLVNGYLAIKSKNKARHRRFMTSAVGVSIAFLVSYLIRFALTGSHPFPGSGVVKTIYLLILLSHMVLAAIVPILVVFAVRAALQERFERHKRLARVLWPMWMYVSVTGVVVYVMLYHLA